MTAARAARATASSARGRRTAPRTLTIRRAGRRAGAWCRGGVRSVKVVVTNFCGDCGDVSLFSSCGGGVGEGREGVGWERGLMGCRFRGISISMLRRRGGIIRGFIGRSWMIRSAISASVRRFWGSERGRRVSPLSQGGGRWQSKLRDVGSCVVMRIIGVKRCGVVGMWSEECIACIPFGAGLRTLVLGIDLGSCNK